MRYSLLLFSLILSCCQPKKQSKDEVENLETFETDTASQEVAETNPENWELDNLYGSYTLETSTAGFTASLIVQPQGRDLAFTVTSRKGKSCEGEVSSSIAIVNYNEKYHTGYSIDENCKLEFIFRHTEDKVDVREIQLCTAHDPLCGFEGTYNKRENN